MKRLGSILHKAICWYLVGYAPIFFLAAALYGGPEGELPESALNGLGFAWVLSVIYYVAAFVVSGRLREALMSRLAGFQERDEREALITASAARATFLFMLAVEIVAFIMTLTKVSLTYDPLAKEPKGLLSIGLGLQAEHWRIFAAAPEPAASLAPAQWQWAGYLLPPNMALVLLLLILLQLAGFRMFSRRAHRAMECA